MPGNQSASKWRPAAKSRAELVSWPRSALLHPSSACSARSGGIMDSFIRHLEGAHHQPRGRGSGDRRGVARNRAEACGRYSGRDDLQRAGAIYRALPRADWRRIGADHEPCQPRSRPGKSRLSGCRVGDWAKPIHAAQNEKIAKAAQKAFLIQRNESPDRKIRAPKLIGLPARR